MKCEIMGVSVKWRDVGDRWRVIPGGWRAYRRAIRWSMSSIDRTVTTLPASFSASPFLRPMNSRMSVAEMATPRQSKLMSASGRQRRSSGSWRYSLGAKSRSDAVYSDVVVMLNQLAGSHGLKGDCWSAVRRGSCTCGRSFPRCVARLLSSSGCSGMNSWSVEVGSVGGGGIGSFRWACCACVVL